MSITSVGPARSGRRSPELLRGRAVAPADPDAVYIALRPLKHGEYIVAVGVEVPGAASWRSLETFVNLRRLRKVEPGEDYERWEDFLVRRASATPTRHPRPCFSQVAFDARITDEDDEPNVTVTESDPDVVLPAIVGRSHPWRAGLT